jgi:hypothetical protein
MSIILQSTIHTLNKSKILLESLSDDILSDHSVPPYYSCIGSHVRHILDFYDCILVGISKLSIDLIDRKRDLKMHKDCNYALKNVERIASKLKTLSDIPMHTRLIVNDDMGLGKVSIEYTLGALLAQANSHAIHHYAIINYILDRLGISLNDDTFGYNPTTPKSEVKLN